MNRKLVGCCVFAALCAASNASAGLFVSTGKTGDQVQCDVNHTQHWTYSVSTDVSGIDGALLTMKRGSQTSSQISFVIFEGTFDAFGSATNLLSVTLASNKFTQSFNGVQFKATAISLLAGHVYTAVLSSNATDSQNKAYFIKGGSTVPLQFVNSSGDPVLGGSIITPPVTPPVPAPGTAVLLAAAGLCVRRRRIAG